MIAVAVTAVPGRAVTDRATGPTAGAIATRSPVRIEPVRWANRGLAVGVVIVGLGLVVPAVFQWHVYASAFAPLSALWRPRVGVGTAPAIAIGVAVALRGIAAADRLLRWPLLLAGAYVVSLAWMFSLALVDGVSGISAVFENPNESLITAHRVGGISTLLHTFIARIPANAPGSWTTHVAGHPPGSLLVFVALVRLGLGSGLAAGLVVTILGATTPVAVLLTLDRLGARPAARRVAPFLAVGPFAIWSAVSADALFAAVLGWSMYALSRAAARTDRATRSVLRTQGWGLVAGLLFGCALMLSYGLAIAAMLLIAVLVAARTWRPAPATIVGAAVVLAVFAAAGFRWWAALPVLHTRYDAGIAHLRPAAYWIWADFAALLLSAGLAAAPAAALVVRRWRLAGRSIRSPARPVIVLGLAALACVAVADLTLMSKAEVERIWLPFMPWLLLGVALLPPLWRTRALAGQVVLALVLQTLLFTVW